MLALLSFLFCWVMRISCSVTFSTFVAVGNITESTVGQPDTGQCDVPEVYC